MITDSIKIECTNSYADSLNAKLINPTCNEVIQETVTALFLLGFSPMQIYSAFSEQMEQLKATILK